MARASTAYLSARAERPARTEHRQTFSRPGRLQSSQLTVLFPFHNLDPERTIRWAVPTTLIAFVILSIGVSWAFVSREKDRIVSAATTDVELVASVIADDIDVRVRAGLDKSPTEALAHAIPLRALSRGQRVYLTDPNGRVVAAYPDPHISGMIADHIGASQPLTVFAEKAGVMRLTLPSGVEALATVRSLNEPLGQVAVVHPMTDVLSDWRTALVRLMIVLFSAGSVLFALAGAYFWQARRARYADASCEKMRDRVDMVLARGRCGLWDWNLSTGRIDWSLSMYQMLGLAACAKGVSVAEVNGLIHPADGDLNSVLGTISSVGAIDRVFRMRKTDGAWIWVRAKAEVVESAGKDARLVGIAIDITETMALEERTARADMRLRDAIETISEAFVVWDAENRLVMCNSKFQRFHDLPNEAVAPGTPYSTVMACGTPPIVQAEVPVGDPQPMGARTFEAQLGDGRWLQINERRTKDGGYVSVGTDITALKHNEEQLIRSEGRLKHTVIDLRKSQQNLEAHAQKLAEMSEKYFEQKNEAEKANRAKSDFLANMSHELRTPLNAILGFSEIMMLESYGELGSPLYQEYSRDIHTSGQYLLGMIADILEMSRLEAGRVELKKTDFPVHEATDDAIAAISAAANANMITIEKDVDVATKLLADQTAVQKILTILLHNSVKYTPPGGRVSLRTRSVGGALNVYVEDTGIGISPDEIAKLGRPFEPSDKHLKNGMRGSGLGLAIARSLVDLHGGTLRIKSRSGQGTLVLVHLPNRGAQTRPSLQVAASSAQATTQPPRFALQPADRMSRKISRTA